LRTGGATESSPVLDADGNIYLSVNEQSFSAGSDGKKRWSIAAAFLVDTSPAVTADGTIYFSAPWHRLWAMKPDGTLKWDADTGDNANLSGSPVIGADGIIYAPDGRVLNAVAAANSTPLAKSPWPMFRANPQHTGRVQK
jgi:outer membrane protein assembly factor BamB